MLTHFCVGSGVTALLRGYEPTVLLRVVIVVSRYEETMADVATLLRLGAERRIDIRQMVGSANAVRCVGYARLRISEHCAGDRLASEVDQLLPPPSHCRYSEKASCRVGVMKD